MTRNARHSALTPPAAAAGVVLMRGVAIVMTLQKFDRHSASPVADSELARWVRVQTGRVIAAIFQ
jgi:hypothetical protein